MNREILFTAKRIDNGKWVEGNLLYAQDACNGYEAVIIPIKGANLYTNEAIGNLGIEHWYKVNPDTVCQCTGLTDKNGKRIWENDIVRIIDDKGYTIRTKDIGTVNFDDGAWYIDKIYRLYDTYERYSFEVIGNKFDNPELL